MRLLHYSAKPIEAFDHARKYEWPHNYKPPGFWVSVEGEDDWYEWCRAEDWGPKDPLVYEVTITEDARILRLTTLAQLDAFHRDWTAPEKYPRSPEVRWRDVMQEWDGLIIAPYQWERRLAMGFMWYYGWDCASGVIWNLDAITSVAPPASPLMARPIEEDRDA